MTAANRKPHYQVTAGVMCEGGRILVSKRSRGSHMGGYWEFPGGKQEEGESLKECLEREIAEELGVTVLVGDRLLTVDYEYHSRVVSLHVFHCRRLAGEPEALQSQEIRWVEVTALKRLDFPPPDLEVIEFLERERRCRAGRSRGRLDRAID